MPIANLTIKELGAKGDGVHDDDRGRVFVDRGLPGDEIRAEITWDEMGLPRGEIREILKASPHRQAAPCPHYDRCGNCSLQHAKVDFYREWKTQIVRDAIKRQGLHPKQWLDTLFLDQPHSRRRATFAAIREGNRVRLGYYRRRSREITNIETCLVAAPELLQIRDRLTPFLVPILPEGRPIDVFIQLVDGAVDVVLTGALGAERLVRTVLEPLLTVATRLSWRAGPQDDPRVIGENGAVVAKFGELRVALPPAAFLQPTLPGEQALVGAVMAALPPSGTFADLFSGCGTFTGPMLTRGAVDAFEFEGPAVEALAKAGAGKPLRAQARDLARRPLEPRELSRYDAVVFDPPRAGCPEQAEALAAAEVPVLIGVSCNPATFARDARLLREGGYRLETVQPVDQFLWSHHVEVVGVFRRVKSKKK